MAREDSLRVTLQTWPIWTEPVLLDVFRLRQVKILAIQLHPRHQTANRQQVGGCRSGQNKTKSLTHKKEKIIPMQTYQEKQMPTQQNWRWSCWLHAKAALHVKAQLSEASLATYKTDHIAGIFLTRSWGKGSMESLKKAMTKSGVHLDRKYLRLPDPSWWALYVLRTYEAYAGYAKHFEQHSIWGSWCSQSVFILLLYLLMSSRDHKATTVSHASEQGSGSYQVTQVFLQTRSPPPAFSVCW